MRAYECIYILNPSLDEQAVKDKAVKYGEIVTVSPGSGHERRPVGQAQARLPDQQDLRGILHLHAFHGGQRDPEGARQGVSFRRGGGSPSHRRRRASEAGRSGEIARRGEVRNHGNERQEKRQEERQEEEKREADAADEAVQILHGRSPDRLQGSVLPEPFHHRARQDHAAAHHGDLRLASAGARAGRSSGRAPSPSCRSSGNTIAKGRIIWK